MSGSVEVQIGHAMDGNLSIPKKTCLRAFHMYWPVRNLIRHVICGSVIMGFFQKFVESSLSMSMLLVHFSMFGKLSEIRSRSLLRSCFLIYLLRNLTGPLSGGSFFGGPIFFLKVIWYSMGMFVWVFGIFVRFFSSFLC